MWTSCYNYMFHRGEFTDDSARDSTCGLHAIITYFYRGEFTDDSARDSTCGLHAIITCFTEENLPMTAPVILRVDVML